MPTGVSNVGFQSLFQVAGGLESFTLATNGSALGYGNQLLGKWSLRAQVLSQFARNPFVEVAFGNVYAGGCSYAPNAPPQLLVTNWQLIVEWNFPSLSWDAEYVLSGAGPGLQGPPGQTGPAGSGFTTLPFSTKTSNFTAAVRHVYYADASLTVTLPPSPVDGDFFLLQSINSFNISFSGGSVSMFPFGGTSPYSQTGLALLIWDAAGNTWRLWSFNLNT